MIILKKILVIGVGLALDFFAREFLFALTAFGNNYDKIYEHLKTFFEGSILESALKDSFKK
ncbi:hypothetical protein BDCR2A_01188 [Borrelia duttonii CR2A]|uniref:Variable large protein n=1 Tax=Borrelia duttonii CR2A TaxID=1432657 RepID=W6THM9_9SPIR|nr:hypothetical protein BDCR2A_01188 [Borrelia duttonii CR2A]